VPTTASQLCYTGKKVNCLSHIREFVWERERITERKRENILACICSHQWCLTHVKNLHAILCDGDVRLSSSAIMILARVTSNTNPNTMRTCGCVAWRHALPLRLFTPPKVRKISFVFARPANLRRILNRIINFMTITYTTLNLSDIASKIFTVSKFSVIQNNKIFRNKIFKYI
jgi:hypothetical protein